MVSEIEWPNYIVSTTSAVYFFGCTRNIGKTHMINKIDY